MFMWIPRSLNPKPYTLKFERALEFRAGQCYAAGNFEGFCASGFCA